jgi:hypothetical protein
MGRAKAITVAMGITLMAGEALGQMTAPQSPSGAVTPAGGPVAPPPGTQSGEAVLIPGIAEFQVSPRAWYLFESFGPRQNLINSGISNLGSDEYLLGGASISARFNSLSDTTFVLTGLAGSNAPAPRKSESFLASTGSIDDTTFTNTATSQLTTNTSRIDIEFLAQTAIPNTDWAWIAGGRFEHHDSTTTGTVATAQTAIGPKGFFAQNQLMPFPTTTATVGIYTLKGGVAGAVPLTADNRLRLFGNIMAVAGFGSPSDTSNYGVIGPDASIGLQYAFSPTITADARYRVMVYFYFDQPPGFPTNYTIYQGPMIGVNFKF